jgi:N-acetylglucosamine kinase-like BadF-type ATPase
MAANGLTPGVFVGIDSGGTRTNVQVSEWTEDAAPHETSYEVSDTLSGALPDDLIPKTVRSILAPLEMREDTTTSRSLPIHVWISAAGFTEWTRDHYVAALNELAPDLLGARIKSVGIANDAVSLLLGLRADGIVIAGTGSNVIVRGPTGDLRQSGGHEWVASDCGSGFWIGLRAIREAYRDMENGSHSVLLQRMRELYGLRPGDDRGLIHKLRDLAVGDENIKKEVARFAATVCDASERGDKAAQNVVKSEAEDLADVTAGALRRTIPREQLEGGIRMVQCGSLIGNPFYRTSFETHLEMRLLSGAGQTAQLDWQRVITGGESAVRLANDLVIDPEQYMDMDSAFRPAVLQC